MIKNKIYKISILASCALFACIPSFADNSSYIGMGATYSASKLHFKDTVDQELIDKPTRSDRNFAGNLAYGMRFDNTRLELSLETFFPKEREFAVIDVKSPKIKVKHKKTSIFLNSYYDFYKSKDVAIYAMLGIGPSFNKFSFHETDTSSATVDAKTSKKINKLNVQIGVGALVPVSKKIDLYTDYRAHFGSKKYTAKIEGENFSARGDKVHHKLSVGLMYKI